MPTKKHVTPLIEAYLDQQLSANERQQVEAHLAVCAACAHQFEVAQRLTIEIKPTLEAVLGQPVPPPALRHQVRQALGEAQQAPSFFNWRLSGRVFNAIGTVAVMALFGFGAWAVIHGQLPNANDLTSMNPVQSASTQEISEQFTTLTDAPSPAPAPTTRNLTLHDELPTQTPAQTQATAQNKVEPTALPIAEQKPAESVPQESPAVLKTPQPPSGTIAFSFYNQASNRQLYEIHLISPDGSNHRLFPLDGVSEPALNVLTSTYQIAFRAWGEQTTPRSLLSSNLEGEPRFRIGGFWEDALPDWSPTEDRLIFSSQRESDRRPRLYTIWGDGNSEKNLRREGKSPTFAPDGYRFAFEGCDNTGNQCGLWIGDLEHSEYGSKPILVNPRAKSPDWSPAGEQIAYMADVNGNWDLYVVNSDGSNLRRLTDDPAVEGLPTWSPDGQWLVFLSNGGGNWAIRLLHLATGQTRVVFNFDGGVYTPPNRDPYGERDWWDEQLSWAK